MPNHTHPVTPLPPPSKTLKSSIRLPRPEIISLVLALLALGATLLAPFINGVSVFRTLIGRDDEAQERGLKEILAAEAESSRRQAAQLESTLDAFINDYIKMINKHGPSPYVVLAPESPGTPWKVAAPA
jgi:hypothetical protein